MSQPKLIIKKYGNRRLYDTYHKRYITLEELTEFIEAGHEVQIIDSKTQEDLTKATLIQIILECHKSSSDGGHAFSSEFLHQLIQYRNAQLSEFFDDVVPQMFRSYLHWQQSAQSQFAEWANWTQQMGQRMMPFPMMPPNNPWMGMWMPQPSSPASTSPGLQTVDAPSNADGGQEVTEADLNALKRQLAQLEKRLKSQQDTV